MEHIRDRSYRRWRLELNKRLLREMIERERHDFEVENYLHDWFLENPPVDEEVLRRSKWKYKRFHTEKDFLELNRKFFRRSGSEKYWGTGYKGKGRCGDCGIAHLCDWCLEGRNRKHKQKHDAMNNDVFEYISDPESVNMYHADVINVYYRGGTAWKWGRH